MFHTLKNGETKAIGKRTVVNLNGTWTVGESIGADEMATAFDHTCPVPAVLSCATPEFDKIGDFESSMRQYCKENWKNCTNGLVDLPVDEEAKNSEFGKAYQDRNYFWYKKTFQAPQKHTYADLIVLMARFGSKVWLNGTAVGENDSCFVSGRYDVADVIKWGEENEVIVRVGAHPGVLPKGNLNIEDCEHEKWYPGIWDDVELYCYDGVKIHSVQIAPKIDPKQITVETEVLNRSNDPKVVTLTQTVKTTDQQVILADYSEEIELMPGELKAVQCVIPLPEAELWSPEAPNLYILETSSDGDTEQNRFGVREAYFRTDTKKFYLNGEICHLRGGLITLERFIEDPLSKEYPFDKNWIRAFLGQGKELMSWNFTKFSLTAAPRRWLDMADEVGFMNAIELPIWCFNPDKPDTFFGYVKRYDMDALMRDVEQWVRDTRCHTSLVYWNAANETAQEWTGTKVIPLGRSLDLEKRAWLNSYSTPVDINDPVENHPYHFHVNGFDFPAEWKFDMLQLESMCGYERMSALGVPSFSTGHAQVISEYEWLWLTRKGELSMYTTNVYPNLPYPHDTPEERQETFNYLLGGLTEYWRAHRGYAQVVYNAWLAGDMGPGHCAVCDNFSDPRTLEFQPTFLKYVREAFKPMGVYLEFWKREVQAGENRQFYVMMINDYLEDKEGTLHLYMKYEDGTMEDLGEKNFCMGPNGSTTIFYNISIPEKLGKAEMLAIAVSKDGLMTKSVRKVEVKKELPPRPYNAMW